MELELVKEIKKWCKDFEASQPANVQIDDDETFEGSAYNLLQASHVALTELHEYTEYVNKYADDHEIKSNYPVCFEEWLDNESQEE